VDARRLIEDRDGWCGRRAGSIVGDPVTYSGKLCRGADRLGGWITGYALNLFGHERGSALFVYALPD
jgi:hypothetical protein